jgi:EH domain-containing protein 1
MAEPAEGKINPETRSRQELQQEIQALVREKLFPLFDLYRIDPGDLEAILKWKPIVLLLGNYSSGKSTLVNELLEGEIQRTGQAPTDDAFTVITAVDPGGAAGEIPGATLVNDETLPFSALKSFGEKLVSHFQMRRVNAPVLENLAIIDSPGMLDSVTEKGRGYDFPGVIAALAKIADLVVLMFDPHKAGTIKETYSAIRNTLPEASGEDRIVFAMSRIDECDNLGDMVRAYGTLCWNLSQMTGRKDIPRIFLTYSPRVARTTRALEVWLEERNELKAKILAAPELRISHVLHFVDRQANDLNMIAEAMARFCQEGRRLLTNAGKWAAVGMMFSVFLLDMILREFIGLPPDTFLSTFVTGQISISHLIVPLVGSGASVFLAWMWFLKWRLPRFVRQSRADADRLVSLETDYRKHTWARVKGRVLEMMDDGRRVRSLFAPHGKHLKKVRRFIERDLNDYYSLLP